MGKFFKPSCQTDNFLNTSHPSFSDLGWENYLTPHASFTDLGWANFLTPLPKTDKFLNTSHASFSDLGWANFWTPSCFLLRFGMSKFLNLSYASFTDLGLANFFNSSSQNWKFFEHLSCFFHRFEIRTWIDWSSCTSVKNFKTFQINNRWCWHFWQRILIKNSNWSIFLHYRKKFTNFPN